MTSALGPFRRTVRELGLGLITLGVIILLFVAYQLFGTNITEAHNQAQLAKQFNSEVQKAKAAAHDTAAEQAPPSGTSAPTTPAPSQPLPAPPPGGAIEHLVIPKIGVDKFVVEGTNENDLRKGPGHYTGTAYPGQIGNTAIAGHRTTYGAPFFRLNELSPGDPIYLTDLQGRTWIYKVSRSPEVVNPDDVSVLDPTPFAELTLTTCNPRFSATSRLVVVARLSGKALPPAPVTATRSTGGGGAPTSAVPAARANVLPATDSLGHGDSNAWTPALLYGALVVLAWLGVRIWINRTRRWHRVLAYVAGIGVCLVPLWFCFENVILLLPPSI